jgi:hypothetical protein
MYLPPVTIAYSQKAPITRQMAAMIERITEKITLWGLAAILRPSVDGPQPDAGPLPLSVASAMPNATVTGINGEPGHTSATSPGRARHVPVSVVAYGDSRSLAGNSKRVCRPRLGEHVPVRDVLPGVLTPPLGDRIKLA